MQVEEDAWNQSTLFNVVFLNITACPYVSIMPLDEFAWSSPFARDTLT
jgi:hypothetical protein